MKEREPEREPIENSIPIDRVRCYTCGFTLDEDMTYARGQEIAEDHRRDCSDARMALIEHRRRNCEIIYGI